MLGEHLVGVRTFGTAQGGFTPDMGAACARGGDAGASAFTDKAAFELGECGHHMKDQDPA